MAEDYYTTLGVHRSASAEEIGRAYRELARKYHPDLNPDDPQAETKFEEVQAAFEVLSDPQQRATYNRTATSFASLRKSAGHHADQSENIENAGRAFAEVRKQSRVPPPPVSWGISGYVFAIIVVTVIWMLTACSTYAVAVMLGSSVPAEEIGPLRSATGLLCCFCTPLYALVMFLLAANYFNR